MAVFSADAAQTINPGESAIFTNTLVPCPYDLVRHRDETGSFLLSGAVNCRCKKVATYDVSFGANIAIAEGGAVGPISVGITIDGATVPATEMIVTPAAVLEYFNVSRDVAVDIWAGCCETVTVKNLSTVPISMQNAIIEINR